MSLLVPLAALHHGPVRMTGHVSAGELALETLDPCIEAPGPVHYDFTATLVGAEVLVEGALEAEFQCQCVRCLKGFRHALRIDPWTALVALEGEEAAPIVNEAVDLTPQIREDSLLGLPQHPVCSTDCEGLPMHSSESSRPDGALDEGRPVSSAWSILDTLKLDR